MQLQHYIFDTSWNIPFDNSLDSEQTLVLVFGSSNLTTVEKPLLDVKKSFPKSIIIGASTSGEILMDELQEDSLVVTVAKFKTTQIKLVTLPISSSHDSFEVGKKMAMALKSEALKSIFILSDGLNVNGSALTNGLNSIVKKAAIVSGGLAGDAATFSATWVVVNGEAKSHYVTAVGFYGDNLHVSYGSRGGWDIFGIKRNVTHSKENVVYELDNQPILDMYNRYLGDKAKDLPASGLLFPLGIYKETNHDNLVVRTILGIDEQEKSITFAGDVPQGSTVCLMKSNKDRLIDAAYNASKELILDDYNGESILAIAISCIGRKLVLKQRVEEELEATLENLPLETLQVGFYSYGEISPGESGCDLHNQTMTLTAIWESDA